MKEKREFYKNVVQLALPVTLQCLLQSSFGVADQIMTGQLGAAGIAGIGLSGKFVSLYTVLINAVAASAGIMIAQYMGKQDEREVGRSFYDNLALALLLAAFFWLACGLFPEQVMGLYTKDAATLRVSGAYLKIVSLTFVPIAVNTMLSALLRCMEAASLPLYAGIAAALANTGLNYVLIFGHFGACSGLRIFMEPGRKRVCGHLRKGWDTGMCGGHADTAGTGAGDRGAQRAFFGGGNPHRKAARAKGV